jgi:hypothetical protein
MTDLNGRERGTKEARMKKAGMLLRATPDIPDANVAQMYKLTQTEVEEIRRQM